MPVISNMNFMDDYSSQDPINDLKYISFSLFFLISSLKETELTCNIVRYLKCISC